MARITKTRITRRPVNGAKRRKVRKKIKRR